MDALKGHLPLHQSPRPEQKNKSHVKEIEDQRSTKDYRIVCPRMLLGRFDFGHDDCPREHPKKIRAHRLVEIPARIRGK